jgi:ATP-dependent DNA ligase
MGDQAYRLAGEQHFEGIISKRADRSYHSGRSEDWRKTKQLASDEFAVVGYTAPKAAAPALVRCCWPGQTQRMAGSTQGASGPGSRMN